MRPSARFAPTAIAITTVTAIAAKSTDTPQPRSRSTGDFACDFRAAFDLDRVPLRGYETVRIGRLR